MEEREGERLKFSHRDIALCEFKNPKPVPDQAQESPLIFPISSTLWTKG